LSPSAIVFHPGEQKKPSTKAFWLPFAFKKATSALTVLQDRPIPLINKNPPHLGIKQISSLWTGAE
jgi:hypothetical protein